MISIVTLLVDGVGADGVGSSEVSRQEPSRLSSSDRRDDRSVRQHFPRDLAANESESVHALPRV